MYHAVVQLLDWASPAVADEEWLHVLIALQELRAASLEIVQDMVQALLDDLIVDVDESLTEYENCVDGPRMQLNTLCWEDTLKHLWAVFHIAKLSGVKSQQYKQANMLLAQIYRDLNIKEPLQKAMDRGSPEYNG